MYRGRRTKEWDKVRAELKKEFEERGITSCEIRLEGCWVNNALSFAHTKKRNDIKNKANPEEEARLLRRVVLACVPCHDVVEKMGKVKMEAYLENIIESRTR